MSKNNTNNTTEMPEIASTYNSLLETLRLHDQRLVERIAEVSLKVEELGVADPNNQANELLQKAIRKMARMQRRIFDLEFEKQEISAKTVAGTERHISQNDLSRVFGALAEEFEIPNHLLAKFITNLAKNEYAEVPSVLEGLSKLANHLHPTEWREKWMAFQCVKNGSYEEALAIIEGMGDKFELSTSEVRALDRARAELDRQKAQSPAADHSTPMFILKDFEYPYKNNKLLMQRVANRRLRVAGIMDEFTYHSFLPECDLLNLSANNALLELFEFNPDVLFIESAWKGKGGGWSGAISHSSALLSKVLDWCKQQAIPIAFWNKEDPVHYFNFLPVARKCDFIFTTDIDRIPYYKNDLGHSNVFLLPFAAQPAVHNPIKKYERKHAFNFAGSYYLRYPERQNDFDKIMEACSEVGACEIYDRNFDNDHPHYEFPDRFKSMIIGKLPFAEIDKAYKGYSFGINMNTIKQSQTMYARRVFELLASGTIVVSNFSRGMRLMFGDIVISSESRSGFLARLSCLTDNETVSRKHKLKGLRSVMKSHTYENRLNYISEKIWGYQAKSVDPQHIVLSVCSNVDEIDQCLKNFRQQKQEEKFLLIVSDNLPQDASLRENEVVKNHAEAYATIKKIAQPDTFIEVFHVNDYYGPNYLMDFGLSQKYFDGAIVTKMSYYAQKNNQVVLINDGQQYTSVEQALARRSGIKFCILSEDLIGDILANPDEASFKHENMLSLDEFNYCQDGSEDDFGAGMAQIDDLVIQNQGVDMERLQAIAETLQPRMYDDISKNDFPTLTGRRLFEQCLLKNLSSKIKLSTEGRAIHLRSTLEESNKTYVYFEGSYDRAELNLIENSSYNIIGHARGDMGLKVVFEFQDENYNKISHQMLEVGQSGTLIIPNNCQFVRIGLRISGSGSGNIGSIVFGSKGLVPQSIIAQSDTLILTKQYPSYEDLYKYGFLHSRVRAYIENGLKVSVFRLNDSVRKNFSEFENVDIANGDLKLLDRTLATGRYQHVLVHLIDAKMWSVLRKYIGKVRVTVWVHGAEIQQWKRREFEFEVMTEEEITRQKKLSDYRLRFWREIVKERHENLHFVFVSEYFKNESNQDLSLNLEEWQYSIVHNFIDPSVFPTQEKTAEDRKKIVSIRPYASRKYANDLSVKAVELLSKKSFFNELQFSFYGDGVLFDDILDPIKHFPNVKIFKGFLSHDEVAAVHSKNGVFLTPTRMDAQGVSRDEAMSSGLVPITSNVTAIPEFVDERCGFLAPGEDAQGLADAIECLYNEPEKYLEMSRAAATRVQQQCGYAKTISVELSLIER